MSPINIYDAKTHLSKLVEQAAAGKDVVIARGGKPASSSAKAQAEVWCPQREGPSCRGLRCGIA
jgi:hypothetical protein